MEKKSKVGKRMMLIVMSLLLIALPLFARETAAQLTPQGNLNAKPEGTLHVAEADYAEEGFIPDLGDGDGESRAWAQVLEYPMYRNGKTGELLPGLATGYEYSKDYRTLIIHMRKGIPWQDKEKWGEVTGEDVKYTYERTRLPESTSSLTGLMQNIPSIEVPDPYTVLVNFKEPAPESWVLMFNSVTAPIVCKKHIETVGVEEARWKPIGSGPYRLVERKSGDYMKFEAVDKHWRCVPEFKYLYLHTVPEESTRVAMLKTGKVDMIPVSTLQAVSMENEPGIKVVTVPEGYQISYVFGGMIIPKDQRYKEGIHRKDPWTDIRVREALNIAIDRKAIIKSIYKGLAGETQTVFNVKDAGGARVPGWENLPPIPYDPARAKKLLAEAGYPNGFSLKLASASGWSPAFEIPKLTEILAAYFKEIGVKVEIQQMEEEVLSNLCREAKDVGMIYPDKESMRRSYAGRFLDKFIPGSEPAIWLDDDHIAMVYAYEKEVDPAKRAAALAAIRNYEYKNWIAIPLVKAPLWWAYRTSVVGDWARSGMDKFPYLEYVRHAKPLNTWRLFNPYF